MEQTMTENQITSLTRQEENSNITVVNEVNVYSFYRTTKIDGEEKSVPVVINNAYAVARLSNIDSLVNLNKKSSIALAIEMARVKKSIAEENGFKTVAQLIHAIHDDLSETTINAYRRVGVVFGDLSTEVFKWKDSIPQNTSITNLVQAVGLVNVNKDTDAITQEEAVKAVEDFKTTYIDSERLHLLLPLSKLKDEIKRINNTIDSTATEVTEEQKTEQTAEQKTEQTAEQTAEQKTEQTAEQTAEQKTEQTAEQKTEQTAEQSRVYLLDFKDSDRTKLFEYAVSILAISDIKPLQSPTYRKQRAELVSIAKALQEYSELYDNSENA